MIGLYGAIFSMLGLLFGMIAITEVMNPNPEDRGINVFVFSL